MRRRKLDYYTKNFSVKDANEFYRMIDIEGTGDFNNTVCNFIRDPEKYKHLKAAFVPNLQDEDGMQVFLSSYRIKFDSMNYLCEMNRIEDLFSDPLDVVKSLDERSDLVALYPEEEINKYFGTESFFSFDPTKFKSKHVDVLPKQENTSQPENQ